MSNCIKCKSDVESNKSFILRKCNHIFCFKCMREHVSKCLEVHKGKSAECSNTSNPCSFKCPQDNCQTIIPDIKIRECLSNSEMFVYDQLSLLASSTEVVKCLTKNCFYAVFVDDEVETFQCEYCKQTNCLKCKKRHDGQCNSHNMDEAEIDRLAEEAIQEQTSRDMEEYYNSWETIPNSDAFECPICCEYILPRKGLLLRNCKDCFCRSCFETTLNSASVNNDFVCQTCNEDINEREIIDTIGKSKYDEIQFQETRFKYFHCKFPDCNGRCDKNENSGCFTCPVCKHVNCLDCDDMHEGVSCEDFQSQHKLIETNHQATIKCFSCWRPISIKEGGCGAYQCECKKQICQFTGKAAGNQGANSCGCTPAKLCHKDCKFGCVPENN